jgi:flavoprotein
MAGTSRRIYLPPVELEERTIEQLPERCQSCGTPLTAAEKQRILDEGETIALCSVCAAEQEPVVDEATDETDAAY